MTASALPSGTRVFVDATVLTYAHSRHQQYGPASQAFLQRIQQGDLVGFTSTHVLSETLHRLMTLEAIARFGWPQAGIAFRLRQHTAEIQQLADSEQALQEIAASPLQILAANLAAVVRSVQLCRQFGLLSNDGLVIALMQQHGLTHLASHDTDFDRVPGITRYAPA
jgi:predicted nucleic acid-binding protein